MLIINRISEDFHHCMGRVGQYMEKEPDMSSLKKVLVGIVLALMLMLGLLGENGLVLPGDSPTVPAVHAADCDSVPPPPGLDCPVQPTPTPTPQGR
jgi:hypothetical protein